MAMVFSESWRSYVNTLGLSKRYSRVDSSWQWQATGGPYDGPHVTVSSTSSELLISKSPCFSATPTANLNLGLWLKISAAPASNANIVAMLDVLGNQSFNFLLTTEGCLAITDGGVVRGGSPLNIADDVWHWVELNIDGACYIDDELQWASSSISLNQPFISLVLLSVPDITVSVGDIIVYDNNTGYPQNADVPIGPVKLATSRPVSDDTIGFLPSEGYINADLINEVALDLNNYVSCLVGEAGDQDLYNYDPVMIDSPAPTRIHAVMLTSYLFNPDIGRALFNHICRSGSTQQTGADIATPIDGDGRYVQTSFPLDPETAAAWSGIALNSALFGTRCAGA